MTEGPGDHASKEDTVSLQPFFEAVWAERRRALLVVVVVGFSYMCFAVATLTFQPTNRTAFVDFRYVFAGLERGEYPNGSPFSSSDILSNANLVEVYRRNELEQQLSFETFRNSLLVFEASPELMFLQMEYQSKLSEPRLPVPERARLEAEYRQKRQSFGVPQYRLQYVSTSGPGIESDSVMEKVLSDVLAVWAEQVAVQKGALGYAVQLLTPAVIQVDPLNSQTLLIRYDQLRLHVAAVIELIDRLSELPGAQTTRVGGDKFSLLDLRTRLDNLLRFQLSPVMRRNLLSASPGVDFEQNTLYLQDRLAEMQRASDVAAARRQQLQEALIAFAAETPSAGTTKGASEAGEAQVLASDTFLDQVIALAGHSGAMEYRKALTDQVLASGAQGLAVQENFAFYSDALRLLREQRRSLAAREPTAAADEYDVVHDRVVEVLTLTNEAYTTISASNMNPRAALYQVTGPYAVHALKQTSAWWLTAVGLLVITSAAVLAAGVFGTLRLVRQRSSR